MERALATIESAMPLYQRSRDPAGHAAALRLAGNAAAELGRHDLALDYLHDAERLDRNGVNVERTRVLIAGELRTLGDLRAPDKLLAQVLLTRDELDARRRAVGTCAPAPGAEPRRCEALADLREADASYARLKLDFNRIDSSSALALALLDAGDFDEADAAADTAVAMERRIRVKAGESRDARALPGGELCALRSAHRSGSGGGAGGSRWPRGMHSAPPKPSARAP